jgi:probable DNA repair protein
MESNSAAEVDAWLREGGMVVAASDRAARAALRAHHRSRREEGFEAWPAPQVFDWQSFVRSEWERRAADGRLVLNSLQEQAAWEEIVSRSGQAAAMLEGPRRNLAAMAMEAHALLCSHAPRYLESQARAWWHRDAQVFSCWLDEFDVFCRDNQAVSASRLPLELIPPPGGDDSSRSPLLLTAFDRILPVQKQLFDAWGQWHEPGNDDGNPAVHFFSAEDAQQEIEACANWRRQQLAGAPESRLLVITQDAASRRGEFERAFLNASSKGPGFRYEFSLGVPLLQVGLARAALLVLRWLDEPLEEYELDWLFASGYMATEAECAALQASMRTLRRRQLERPRWTLRTFLAQRSFLQDQWVERMNGLAQTLQDAARRERTAMDWSELAVRLLEDAGWPGQRPLTSDEFQAANRLRQALDLCGSLAFLGGRIGWKAFVGRLQAVTGEMLFAPQTEDAPVIIAGPAESAGITADAIWFLGASEDAWPAHGNPHPLLPLEVQREARMPHGSAQFDWELSNVITRRIANSAREVSFSYARQDAGADARPSRLVTQIAGLAQPLPPALLTVARSAPLTERVIDASRIPLSGAMVRSAGTRDDEDRERNSGAGIRVHGGAKVLTFQSHCPFKSFATFRLGAEAWEPAEQGLTAPERGSLLHKVMASVWSGPTDGIRSLGDLKGIADLEAFVEKHVQQVLPGAMPARARDLMPRRYLELEERRLKRLITEWLKYESTRVDFAVEEFEATEVRTIAGLTLKLRLDRLDRLSDGTFLVIDYKTGDAKAKLWELPRPEDVQLPLYAGFGLKPGQDLGGLVFARIRAGEREKGIGFSGYVTDCQEQMFAHLSRTSALMKNALTAEQVMDWREKIEELARAYLEGRADVDPREAPKTCERCGMYTLCRIPEQESEDEETEEDSNE